MVNLRSHTTRLGVLDIGSNTIHMLIVDAAPGARPDPEASTKSTVRLMKYLKDDGSIKKSGIEAIQRDMQRERDAELKAAYDALDRLTLKCQEYGASAEKRQVALQIIEDAQCEANKAWNYELECMKDFSAEVRARKRLSAEKIAEEAEKLSAMETRAAVAFQLFVMAQQIGMRFEGDYTRQRIETDGQITRRMADGFSSVRGEARLALSEKISKVGGKPLAIAERSEDDREVENVVLGLLREAGKNVNRLNPMRMRAKAKADISEKRAKLQDVVSNENVVREIADRNKEELETINFAFNEADTIVILSLIHISEPTRP